MRSSRLLIKLSPQYLVFLRIIVHSPLCLSVCLSLSLSLCLSDVLAYSRVSLLTYRTLLMTMTVNISEGSIHQNNRFAVLFECLMNISRVRGSPKRAGDRVAGCNSYVRGCVGWGVPLLTWGLVWVCPPYLRGGLTPSAEDAVVGPMHTPKCP